VLPSIAPPSPATPRHPLRVGPRRRRPGWGRRRPGARRRRGSGAWRVRRRASMALERETKEGTRALSPMKLLRQDGGPNALACERRRGRVVRPTSGAPAAANRFYVRRSSLTSLLFFPSHPRLFPKLKRIYTRPARGSDARPHSPERGLWAKASEHNIHPSFHLSTPAMTTRPTRCPPPAGRPPSGTPSPKAARTQRGARRGRAPSDMRGYTSSRK